MKRGTGCHASAGKHTIYNFRRDHTNGNSIFGRNTPLTRNSQMAVGSPIGIWTQIEKDTGIPMPLTIHNYTSIKYHISFVQSMFTERFFVCQKNFFIPAHNFKPSIPKNRTASCSSAFLSALCTAPLLIPSSLAISCMELFPSEK